MEFTSFSWISEFVSFTLQSYCFFLFPGRKSLRLLLIVLCLRNLVSIATHNMPWPYFYQLYFGRIIVALIALWAVADVSCYPATPKWTMRLPVAFAALLAIPYWPTNPVNGPGQLEEYRLFCIGLAIFTLALHTLFRARYRQSITLQLLLLVTLTVEALGSVGMIKFGYHPKFQMFCWWIGLVALGSFAASKLSPLHPASLGSQGQNGESTEVVLRLPLQSRLPHSQVFERWTT